MKKLLLIFLIMGLIACLLVGCNVIIPTDGEGENESEIADCPIVTVSSQVAVEGKTYIKGGAQTITVEFAEPTEIVSVYVGENLRVDFSNNNPEGIPDTAREVIMYPDTDKKIYTGSFNFLEPRATIESKLKRPLSCEEDYIYVLTCNTCAPCKYPYIVDTRGPESEIDITAKACTCSGIDLMFNTPAQTSDCGEAPICCGDDCSGFASYTIDLYDSPPFNDCCDVPCINPVYSCPAGLACPIDCTLSCITGGNGEINKNYYMVATLLDVVGNRTRYYATITLDEDSIVNVTEYYADNYPTEGVACSTFSCGNNATYKDPISGEYYGTIGDCMADDIN